MKEFLYNQYKNLYLWAAFLVVFGGAWYFSLDTEPNFHFPILITLLSALIIFKNKNIMIRAVALFLFGFFYSMSFTHIINTPQIKDSFGDVHISGTITDIDFRDNSTRLFLKIPINQINSTKQDDRDVFVRFSVKDTNQDFEIGDNVVGTAIIFRPSSKYAPESFDFARWAYFSNFSGMGFFKDYEIIHNIKQSNNIRTKIHENTKSVLTDALVLGYKQSIPETHRKIWQSIGLGHVWSISGFHMTLIGGWLFALFYFLFRLIAPITRRIPAKYPAMICAWCGLLGYVCLSGISVTTIRAFLMTTLIFLAAIIGRGALSLRNACMVFILLFLIKPFYVMTPGFQLSFAAIFGLLAFFKDKQYQKRIFLQRFTHAIYLTLAMTIIATLSTLPFMIAHFGFIPLYGLVGNLIILPIFSFAIMPLVILGTGLALLGNYSFLDLSDKIYSWALNIGQHIANLPYSDIPMPHISNLALLLAVFGMMCLISIVNQKDSENVFFRHANKFVGGVFIFSAIVFFIATPRPLVYVAPDHNLIGFVVDGKIQFNKSKSSKHYFAFNTWRKFNHEIESDKNERYKCDKGLCIYKTKKWNLAYMKDFTTIMENIDKICGDESFDYIITPFELDAKNCHAKVLDGGILIYPSNRVRQFFNHRPWHNQH